MSFADVDMTLYYRGKHTPPPSVLLLSAPPDRNPAHRTSPSVDLRSHQQKSRHPPPVVGFRVNHLDIHDQGNSSLNWQRHSDKVNHLNPAPDVAYRFTYLEEIKRDKVNSNQRQSSSRSPSPRSKLNTSLSSQPSEPSQPKHVTHQYRTIYDYIRDSIRQIERQRNVKQQNISSRVQRPQNVDSTFRRVLAEKKPSARTSLSRSSSTSTATTRTLSSLLNNDFKSPQSFVNYINHSRVPHSTTPSNQSTQQQRPILS